MPELPEVEAARRCLERWARRREVRKVRVRDRRIVASGSPPLTRLLGAHFSRVDSRGKQLLIHLTKGQVALGLWSHLGMSGKWLRRAAGEEPPRFSRVQLDLSGGVTLHYTDARLLGRMRLVPEAAFAQLAVVKALGPDPLHDGIDPARLAERLARSRKPIKPQLLDQRLVPGVGNIQASEALFRAGIDPRRPSSSLTRPELARLARAIRASIDDTLAGLLAQIGLREARAKIARGASRGVRNRLRVPEEDVRYVEDGSGPNPFRVYGRKGERCPRCRRSDIARIVQDTRATYFCPRCQK